jgi:hypothetical protein
MDYVDNDIRGNYCSRRKDEERRDNQMANS